MKIYPIAYSIFPGKWTKEDLEEMKLGGCDGIIIHSLIFPPDGSRSEQIISTGPDGKELSDLEYFKSWCGLAYALKDSKTLGAGYRMMCETIFEAVKYSILKETEGGNNNGKSNN